MNMTTDIELIHASDITVDASVIDVSEVESQEDKDFLVSHGTEILEIDAKAEYTIKKVVATIQGRASLEKGRVIAEVQDRFRAAGTTGLAKWYASVRIEQTKANALANAYRSTQDFQELFDGLVEPHKVLECSDSALSKIYNLPQEYKEQKLADIAAGDAPSDREMRELIAKPEVKLSKAEELLTAAKARKEGATSPMDRYNADEAISKFTQQIADLKAQIEEEKLRTAQEAQERTRIEAELQKLKFDDAKVRAERVKKLSNTLTVSIPQVTADVAKFFAEIDQYPEEVRKHVYDNAKQLADRIADNL